NARIVVGREGTRVATRTTRVHGASRRAEVLRRAARAGEEARVEAEGRAAHRLDLEGQVHASAGRERPGDAGAHARHLEEVLPAPGAQLLEKWLLHSYRLRNIIVDTLLSCG